MSALAIFAEGDPNAIQLLPEFPELVMGFISFGVVFAFLYKFVFPRLGDVMHERRERIHGQIAEADRVMAEAKSQQNEYNERLKEAHLEANRIIELARQDAEVQRESIVRKAKQDAENIRENAHRAASEEHKRVLIEARDDIGDLAISLASRIVQREIDVDRHSDIVDEFIDSIETK